MKKNRNPQSSIVYSTNPYFRYEAEAEETVTLPPAKQQLRVMLDNRKHAGKKVTVVRGFAGSQDDLNDLARMIKTHCAAGGTIEGTDILIQGDLRQKIVDLLTKKGYRAR